MTDLMASGRLLIFLLVPPLKPGTARIWPWNFPPQLFGHRVPEAIYIFPPSQFSPIHPSFEKAFSEDRHLSVFLPNFTFRVAPFAQFSCFLFK